MFLNRFNVSAMLSFLQKTRRIQGELLWILTGHAAAFLGGLFGIKLLTNMLGPSGYGLMALGLSIAGFLTTFLHNPISNSAARFYSPYRDSGKGMVYFGVLRRIHARLLVALIPLVTVVPFVVYHLKDSLWGGITFWGLVYGTISGIGVSFLAWQNAARDRKFATVAQISDVWLRIGCAILAVMLFGTGLAALAGYTAGTLLTVLWQYQRFICQKNQLSLLESMPEESQLVQAKHEFIAFVLPFIGYAPFTVITLYADRWVLQLTAGADAVGIYAALFQIAASPVNLLFAIINQLMVPIIYERAGTMTSVFQRLEVRHLLARTMLVATICSGVGIVLTVLLARPVALLLTTDEFARHSGLLWMLVLGLSLWQIGQLMTLKGMCANRPGIYLLPKGVHSLVLLGAGIYLVIHHGVVGMAAAFVVASAVYLFSVVMVNMRLERLIRNAE